MVRQRKPMNRKLLSKMMKRARETPFKPTSNRNLGLGRMK